MSYVSSSGWVLEAVQKHPPNDNRRSAVSTFTHPFTTWLSKCRLLCWAVGGGRWRQGGRFRYQGAISTYYHLLLELLHKTSGLNLLLLHQLPKGEDNQHTFTLIIITSNPIAIPLLFLSFEKLLNLNHEYAYMYSQWNRSLILTERKHCSCHHYQDCMFIFKAAS